MHRSSLCEARQPDFFISHYAGLPVFWLSGMYDDLHVSGSVAIFWTSILVFFCLIWMAFLITAILENGY
jgi:hypothetical protein